MTLEDEFTAALRGTIDVARQRHYIPHYFIQMLDTYGGMETARRLIAAREPQAGLMKLWELGLLDESMEAVMLRQQFQPLFSADELAEARRRLEELGVRFPADG
jgi:hypothetical protein